MKLLARIVADTTVIYRVYFIGSSLTGKLQIVAREAVLMTAKLMLKT
jgi:hypothetical protein